MYIKNICVYLYQNQEIMKNIYLLSTDCPSKIVGNDKGFLLVSDEFTQRDLDLIQAKFFNIYILGSELVKEGDWFIKDNKLVNKRGNISHSAISEPKIVLTTDKKLINDNVQSIDDELLEWIINNPNREFIKTYYNPNQLCYDCVLHKEDLLNILGTNTDWFIELENKDNKDKLIICNYYSATIGPNVALNYPTQDKDWISTDKLINNYRFVKSWTPDDKIEHINSYKSTN